MTTDEESEEAEAEEVSVAVLEDQEVEEEEEAEASTLDSEVEEAAAKAAEITTTTGKKEREVTVSAEITEVHQETEITEREDHELMAVMEKDGMITGIEDLTVMTDRETTEREVIEDQPEVVAIEREEVKTEVEKEDHQDKITVTVMVAKEKVEDHTTTEEMVAMMITKSQISMVRDQEEAAEAAVAVAEEVAVMESKEVGVKDVAEAAMTTQEEAAEAKEEAEVAVKAEEDKEVDREMMKLGRPKINNGASEKFREAARVPQNR